MSGVEAVEWFRRQPTGGTVYVTPAEDKDSEEPWSSYRKLNEGLEKLATFLDEAVSTDDPGAKAAVIREGAAQAQELAQQAKTVETAAMVRALEYVGMTLVRDLTHQVATGENFVYAVSQLREGLRHLISQVSRS